MYRSFIDLQPVMATIAITAADVTTRRPKTSTRIAPSPRAAS
jgi:hypothetical protein